MTDKVEKIIEEIEQCSESELISFDFRPCFRLMRDMSDAMETLVKRVDAGEARSTKTYNQFKAILEI
jgi:hypothetical protein